MEITWLGHSCFRIRGREAAIVTDPCPPSSGYTIGKPTAIIVTVSHAHENHSFVKAVAGKPVLIERPGEYEIHGAFVTGIRTYHDERKGETRGANLSFDRQVDQVFIVDKTEMSSAQATDRRVRVRWRGGP